MLQENKKYTLSEFVKILKESQEFKPVKGENVDSEDKKNNGKAVKDILKNIKDYDGGVKKETKRENPRDIENDFNKTTLDVKFAYEPSDEYKKRVKAQVHGYASAENEKNSKMEEENESLDFEGNKEFYDADKKKWQKHEKAEDIESEAGLKHYNKHKLKKEKGVEEDEFEDRTVFKESKDSVSENNINTESKIMKRLNFSKTVFLNESEMMKKIPDDMKKEGNKFYMRDSIGNEYLIECVKDEVISDFVHTKVVEYSNKQALDETFSRMKALYNYKSDNGASKNAVEEKNRISQMIAESKKFVNTPKKMTVEELLTESK